MVKQDIIKTDKNCFLEETAMAMTGEIKLTQMTKAAG